MRTLKSGGISGFTAMTALAAEQVGMIALGSGAFTGLSSLQSLLLAGNSITTIASGAFDRIGPVKSLDLSDQPLTGIVSGALDGLASLTRLYVYSGFGLWMDLLDYSAHNSIRGFVGTRLSKQLIALCHLHRTLKSTLLSSSR